MSEFVEALQLKIQALEDEREELEDSLSRIDAKLETLRELLEEESGEPAPAPKKRGRPKGSKNKKKAPAKKAEPKKDDGRVPTDELLAEAATMEGTDPEIAKRLASRRFTAQPREGRSYGPGVHPGAGGKEKLKGDAEASANASISIDEGE
jgi:predicted nuclease with TOPRIM domain